MSIDIVRGTNDKPVSSKELAKLLSQSDELSGQLFIGYPIINTPDGRHRIDAVLISQDKGIIIFDLIDGKDTYGYGDRQDDSYNRLEARLKTSGQLTLRRKLRIPIHIVTFAPGVSKVPKDAEDDYLIANSANIVAVIKDFHWDNQDKDNGVYDATLSALENISTIRKNTTKRTITEESSRGGKLKKLESEIATLDQIQLKTVIETAEGVQRIRGLAGSGKTIALALKAAYLHAQHPDWRIAVTFHTRSLKELFRRLIRNFVFEQIGKDPDWENLRIINAWGAPRGGERDGIYHEFCRLHEVDYLDFGSAKKFGKGKEFAGACELALSRTDGYKKVYDAVLIDEAQDFPPVFLKLCYEILNEPKRLVYAYDELQNLSGESLPPPEEIFGKRQDGNSRVSFDEIDNDQPKQDIILGTCYRNSRPVLITAHGLGFGIYRAPKNQDETGLVQMFDHPQLWEEIGYRRKEGELEEGSPVTLVRGEDTSPKFLEDHSDIDDLIKFIHFNTEDEQTEWLVNAISNNLSEDELRHDDIVVINPDPLKTRKKAGPIRRKLLEAGINSHLAGVDTPSDVFFLQHEKSITFTGIHRAKGNEAGMVYIINAQDCHAAWRDLASIRNRLFTAITRSKAWVRVLGVGASMKELMKEYDDLKERNFELKFTYPTERQRRHLRVVHRDMTVGERKQVQKRQRDLGGLLQDFESGNLHIEDIDRELIDKLKVFLNGESHDYADPS